MAEDVSCLMSRGALPQVVLGFELKQQLEEPGKP